MDCSHLVSRVKASSISLGSERLVEPSLSSQDATQTTGFTAISPFPYRSDATVTGDRSPRGKFALLLHAIARQDREATLCQSLPQAGYIYPSRG